jgi:hypothetical protein
MTKEFNIFKDEFMKWYDKFELSQFRVYFEEDKDQTYYSAIFTYHDDGYAMVKLNSDADFKSIGVKYAAKHEAIHLLISDLADLASSRYITSSELLEAEEKLVNKLERLIK